LPSDRIGKLNELVQKDSSNNSDDPSKPLIQPPEEEKVPEDKKPKFS